MSKKISVITVNYNDKAGLERTLESVVNQTWKDFEFVVIDGGSNDGSKELIEKYSDAIDYWVSEPDKGVYNAMNKGIRAANGEFVIFMNGGDTFYDSKVLENVEGLLTDQYDIYYGDSHWIKKNSDRKRTYPEKLSFSFFYTSTLSHQSSFIRKQLFYDHFFYKEEYKIASDWDFFIYTICHANVPYKYLALPVSNFDFFGMSSVDTYKKATEEERRQTIERYFPLFAEDYKAVGELNSKRIRQVFHIKQFPVAWKILKSTISVLLVFLPKIKK